MSKICFLIAAHKNQNQLMRLLNHLKKDFDIYVHIDKKSKLDIKSFKIYYVSVSQILVLYF